MMFLTYVQHENFKHVIFFFEQVVLLAQTWPYKIDSLTNLKIKYNIGQK